MSTVCEFPKAHPWPSCRIPSRCGQIYFTATRYVGKGAYLSSVTEWLSRYRDASGRLVAGPFFGCDVLVWKLTYSVVHDVLSVMVPCRASDVLGEVLHRPVPSCDHRSEIDTVWVFDVRIVCSLIG